MRGGCTGAAMRHVPNQPVRIAGRPPSDGRRDQLTRPPEDCQQVPGSAGNAREARLVLPRGVDDHVYRSITPATPRSSSRDRPGHGSSSSMSDGGGHLARVAVRGSREEAAQLILR